jgi:hypothetical protein
MERDKFTSRKMYNLRLLAVVKSYIKYRSKLSGIFGEVSHKGAILEF